MTSSSAESGVPKTTRLGLGVALGLVASAAFAFSGPTARSLFDAGWSPIAAVFWRCVLASLVMVPLGLWSMRGRLRDVLAEWRPILAFGAMAVGVAQLFFFAAVDRIDVSVALLLEYMSPVLLVAVAWLRTRQAPPRLVLAGMAAAVAGLVCVLSPGGSALDPIGVLFAAGATVGAAFYFTISARPTTLTPIALAGFGLLAGAVVLGLAIVAHVFPYAAPLVDTAVLGATVPWWVPVAFVALVPTALAYSLGVAANALMGSRLGSFVSLSEVLFAALLSAALLGEIPTWLQVTGAVLIVAGVVLVRLASSDNGTPEPASPEPLPDPAPEPVQS